MCRARAGLVTVLVYIIVWQQNCLAQGIGTSAWVYFDYPNVRAGYGITSSTNPVVYMSDGRYRIILNRPQQNTKYAVIISANTLGLRASAEIESSNQIIVNLVNSNGTPTNGGFSLAVIDSTIPGKGVGASSWCFYNYPSYVNGYGMTTTTSPVAYMSRGRYRVLLNRPKQDKNYAVIISPSTHGLNATAEMESNNQVLVNLVDNSGAATDGGFTLAVFDTTASSPQKIGATAWVYANAQNTVAEYGMTTLTEPVMYMSTGRYRVILDRPQQDTRYGVLIGASTNGIHASAEIESSNQIQVYLYNNGGDPIDGAFSLAVIDITSPPSSAVPDSGANGIATLSVLPNPASSDIRIEFLKSRTGITQVLLIDPTGRAVYHHLEGTMDPGIHHISMDASALPSGLYWCIIACNGLEATAPVMVVR